MGFIGSVAGNTIFLSAIVSIFISQLCKMVLASLNEKKLKVIALFNLAGMPSSHTAAAISALSVIYLKEGATTSFMVMLALVVILVDILLTVDRSIGVHAAMINSFLEFLPGDLKLKYQPVRTEWGHKMKEIVAGGFIGYIVAYLGWTLLG